MLAVCLTVPLAVGVLSGLSTVEGVQTWYREIAKPGFTPPDAVFGPVWTALYLMMGVAVFLFWRAETNTSTLRAGLALFGAQLIVNGLWSVFFFGMQAPLAALLDIVVLLALLAITMRVFYHASRFAGALLAPYLAWVSFATALNFEIWRLNA
jgi:tryptophan-rich sensory protein